MSYYVYLGPLGEVVRDEASFIASKDGFLIGTYDTFGKAMEDLASKEENDARISLLRQISLNPNRCPICANRSATMTGLPAPVTGRDRPSLNGKGTRDV
jgi:hypothetical protein